MGKLLNLKNGDGIAKGFFVALAMKIQGLEVKQMGKE